VFLSERPEKFAKIGVVEVRGGTLEQRVAAAQKVARKHGGNAVVLLGSSTGVGTHMSHETVTSTTDVSEPGELSKTATTKTSVPVSHTYSYEVDRYLVIHL